VIRALAAFCALASAAPGVAAADPFDRLAEGAPLYAELRPIALASAMKRLGVDQIPDVQKIKRQLGVDPLDANLLAPTGLDVAAPIAAALFEPLPGGRYHHRAVATIRDQPMFTTFFGAIAASGQAPVQLVDPASPLGKLGVRLSATLPDGSVVIGRIEGETLIVDALGVWETGKKPPTAQEAAKLFPLAVKSPFKAGRGARRLFTPEAAAVVYGDGRKLPAFLEVADAPGNKPRGKEYAACRKAWASAVPTFDDAAASLSVDADGIEWVMAWGSQGVVQLGGLRFRPVDDGGLDVEALSKKAPLTLALYAANLSPFVSLKRLGPQKTFDALADSVQKCGAPAWGHVLVRSWPQALGAIAGDAQASGKTGGDPMMGTAVNALGQLRNVALVLRDGATPRGAIAATFDPAARAVLDLFFATAPGGGTLMAFGKRSPTVFHLNQDMGGVVAALETLSAGPAALTVTDSDESLGWIFKTSGASQTGLAVPLLAAHADGPQLSKMQLLSSLPRDFLDGLARLHRLDGKIATDGDLLRVTVRTSAR
jgi:hypothetical protein